MNKKPTLLILGEHGFIAASVRSHLGDYFSCQAISFARFRDLAATGELKVFLQSMSPDYVINCFGLGQSAASFEISINGNVLPSMMLVDAMRAAHVTPKRLVLLGSAAEYGIPLENPVQVSKNLRPLSCYGVSKYLHFEFSQSIARIAPELNSVYLRPFNLIGPGIAAATLSAGIRAKLAKASRERSVFLVDDHDLVRDFIDVQDVVRAIHLSLLHAKSGSSYDICSGRPTKLLELASELNLALPTHKRVEILKAAPTKSQIPGIWGDPSPLTADTGWKPLMELSASCLEFMRDMGE